jgi:phenylacetate-CoA ligase
VLDLVRLYTRSSADTKFVIFMRANLRQRRPSGMSSLSAALAVPGALRTQYRSRERLDAAIVDGVRDALAYAREHVPAYADPSYHIDAVTSLDDIAALPLLRKVDVLAAGVDAYHSGEFREADVRRYTTSGSTGMMLDVWHDDANFGHDRAVNVRRFLATKRYWPWSRLVHFKPYPWPNAWYQRIGLYRRQVVFSGLPIRTRIDRLLAVRPHAIVGYPVMLRDLLRALSDEEMIRLRRSLRVVFTESELMTPAIRAQLADGFGVPVFDEFSAYELLHIGFDCIEGQMHIAEDRCYVEIVDADGRAVPDGVEGYLVVTGYRERAMPLLRYWLGDRAVRRSETCECGRTLRRLELHTGRADDYVVLPDGERMYAGTFIGMALKTPGIAECMIRQDKTGRITVHLVPDRRVGRNFADLAADGRAWLYGSAGREFDLDFAEADALELTPGGKGRFVVSDYRPS